jgi:NhaP-type Na+/H+ or K+/H+ antiporter
VTSNQVLLGAGLIMVLAVGSQVLASRLRIPALIILLPAGFTAGALTTSVNPERLLGAAFQPLVSLAVAVILYDSGLALDFGKLRGHTRRVVRVLIWIGVPVTWAFGAVCARLLLGMPAGTALMLGAILVVSGPTVVGPLLGFIRPVARLQRVLAWEGSLIDPVGGILGAVVFHSVVASTSRAPVHGAAQFLFSVSVGVLGGGIGTGLLWLCLCKLDLGEVLGTSAQLACVVAVAAGCDIVRDDAGLIAAVGMGLAVANLHGFSISARRPFFETLVQLIIGLLFVSISATVTPTSLRPVILPTAGLVIVLVVAARPLAAFLATVRTDLARNERQFIGWMAPRGIVAAATATTFGTELTARHVGGAAKILPVTFLVIVATVALYGLTAVPVARYLGVTRPARSCPLLVGSEPWVIDLARALRSAGLPVLMWASQQAQRDQISGAGMDLVPGALLASAAWQGAELEGITTVLLLTGEDDFNALACTILAGNRETSVYRLAPRQPIRHEYAGLIGGDTLFAADLTSETVVNRYDRGARSITLAAGEPVPAEAGEVSLLFVIHPDGVLDPVTKTVPPQPQAGDTLVLLAARPEAARGTTGGAPPDGSLERQSRDRHGRQDRDVEQQLEQ